MARSKKKLPYLSYESLSKNFNKKSITMYTRRGLITSKYVDKKVFVYNGKRFHSFFVSPEHVGLNFGELVSTRKFEKHKKSKKVRSLIIGGKRYEVEDDEVPQKRFYKVRRGRLGRTTRKGKGHGGRRRRKKRLRI